MSRVCVLGANGFIGKNLIRCNETWTGVTRMDLDLTDQNAVTNYFKGHTYDVVIHCAVIGGSRLKNSFTFRVVQLLEVTLPQTHTDFPNGLLIDALKPHQIHIHYVYGGVMVPENYPPDLALFVNEKDI